MKFAVVEYDSKSGNVWRHSSQRPNYLANPQKEIDPTSFGCYVSALAGEHIPLKGLVIGPINQTSGLNILYRKIYKRLLHNWPSNYSLDYLLRFDALLMVHQLSDTSDMIRAIRRLKKLRTDTQPLLIGVPTQPYGLLKQTTTTNPKAAQELKEFINECDVFVSVVKQTTSWYANQSSTPVKYLPQPYPVLYASQYLLPRTQKEKTILIAGVSQRPNIIQGQQVASLLQQHFPEYEIIVPKVPNLNYNTTQLSNTRYRILPFELWQKHLTTLAKTALVINTDYTMTRGRVQTDCAAVGTPSLGGNSDAQTDLFPELASTPSTPTNTLFQLGQKLLTNERFFNSTIAHAHANLQKYNYQQSASRLLNLIEEIRTH